MYRNIIEIPFLRRERLIRSGLFSFPLLFKAHVGLVPKVEACGVSRSQSTFLLR